MQFNAKHVVGSEDEDKVGLMAYFEDLFGVVLELRHKYVELFWYLDRRL